MSGGEATERLWAIVPAAGRGTRAGGDLPKQYQPLHGLTMIEHSLRALASHPRIAGLVVVLARDDAHWPGWSALEGKPVRTATGGAERADSVLAGLLRLVELGAQEGDWVLVHDAARPNLARSELERLLAELADDPVGGLLAVPARDTLKRIGADGRVAETVDRSLIWQAYTPQMFRFAALHRALADALVAGVAVTDEASALEWAGQAPRLVEGRADNLKITRPEDLEWLRQRWAHKH